MFGCTKFSDLKLDMLHIVVKFSCGSINTCFQALELQFCGFNKFGIIFSFVYHHRITLSLKTSYCGLRHRNELVHVSFVLYSFARQAATVSA